MVHFVTSRFTCRPPSARVRRTIVVLAAAALLVPLFVSDVRAAPTAAPVDDYQQVVEITFPVAGRVWFADDYAAGRSGGRRHQATDICAPKDTPVFAAVDGVICWLTGVGEPVPAYGYMLRICGDDGRRYSYLHLSNDRPGTDDDQGDPLVAYASGLRVGTRVTAGQHVGFLGDSGNAEETDPHLHFEIWDGRVEDPRLAASPWKQGRLNPYPSLMAAQQRGEVPGAGARLLRLQSPPLAGDDVRALQQGLAGIGATTVAGAPVVVDGSFGGDTDHAVRAFQEQAGLQPSGLVGPKTMAALDRAVARASSSEEAVAAPANAWPGRYLRLTSPRMSGDDVRTFQARLAGLGYRGVGGTPLVADGWWGPDTEAAAREFIRAVGLPDVAVVGPRTWAAAFPQ
jgi:peptidoglycan hydrolase-like protein with peptidoglycan-binding domain